MVTSTGLAVCIHHELESESILIVPVHDAYSDSKPGDWTFMMIQSWKPEDPNYDPSSLQGDDRILADMKRRAKEFGPNFDFLTQSIPAGTQCWHNRLSSWTPEQWDNRNGTVTLGGDAAHSLTFRKRLYFGIYCVRHADPSVSL